MNLILLEPSDLSENGIATLHGAQAEHARSVLKASPGQTIRIGVVNGPIGVATILAVDDQSVSLRCALQTEPPVRPQLDLLLALPRPKVLRRLWPQLAALGVGQIILTNAAKVERDYFDAHIVTEASYRPLLIEGLRQARDTWLPAVSVHKQFRVLIEDDLATRFPRGRRLVAHPGAGGRDPLRTVRADDRVLLAVGPEGGWTDFELQLLATHGFEQVDVGSRTLRTDTACIALIALVHAALRTTISEF